MHRDDGSTLPLVAGLFALVLGAACAIVDVSSLFLERARIAQVADSAARVGAEAFDITDVTVFDSDTRVALQPDSVARAVADYIALSEPRMSALCRRPRPMCGPPWLSSNLTGSRPLPCRFCLPPSRCLSPEVPE